MFGRPGSWKQPVNSGASGEDRCVDLRLKVSLVDVPVADVHDDRPDREDAPGSRSAKKTTTWPRSCASRISSTHGHDVAGDESSPSVRAGICSSRIVAVSAERDRARCRGTKNVKGALSRTSTGSPAFVAGPPFRVADLDVTEFFRPSAIACRRSVLLQSWRAGARSQAGVVVHVRSRALGRPVVHCRPARTLVGDALHVEPVVEADPELDDSRRR